MIDLFFVRVCLRVRLADTLRYDFAVTVDMAGDFAIRALHACRVLEELLA